MASNLKMRIAAGATVLGLGGLAGYALGSNDGQQAQAGSATAQDPPKPKVHTQVVHRTIHVRPKGKTENAAAGSSAGSSGGSGSAPAAAIAPAPAATPVSNTSYTAPSTGTSGSSSPSGSSTSPPSTHTSGGGSGAGSSYEADDGGEHEYEGGESEGGDD